MGFIFSMLFFLLLGFGTVFVQILKGEAKESANLKILTADEAILIGLGVVDKANAVSPGPVPGDLRPLSNAWIDDKQKIEPAG